MDKMSFFLNEQSKFQNVSVEKILNIPYLRLYTIVSVLSDSVFKNFHRFVFEHVCT